MASPEYTRAFQLQLRDGRVWHGAQFPTGHVAIDHPGEEDRPSVMDIALSLGALLEDRHPEDPFHGARVVWPDETCPPS